MKRLILVLALLAGAGTLAPSAADAGHATVRAFPVTVVDDHGNVIRLTRAPQRIITLYAAYTEILFALGLEKRLVADASRYVEGATGVDGKLLARRFRYPQEWPSSLGRDYPVRAPRLTHVEGGCCGTPFNLETIEKLQPDLIIAPYYQTELPTYQKLHDLGLKVMFLDPSSVTGIMHDITLVGRATGAVTQARTLVQAMRNRLNRLHSRLLHVKSRPTVFYELDASTNPQQPFTAGPGTVPDEAIHLAGGRNIADSITTCSGTTCYPQISLEEIVRDDPKIVVLADAAYGTTPQDVKGRQGWSTIAAARTGRIYPIDPDVLSRFGPRVIIGVEDLARLIHPEVFKKPA